jgi:hypothetical protein
MGLIWLCHTQQGENNSSGLTLFKSQRREKSNIEVSMIVLSLSLLNLR